MASPPHHVAVVSAGFGAMGQEDEAGDAEEDGKAEPRREIDGAGARVEESGLDQLAPEHPVLTRVAGDVLVDEGDEPLERSRPLGLSRRTGWFRRVRPSGGAAAQTLAVAREAEHDIGGKRPADEAEHRKGNDRVVAEAVDEGEDRLHRGAL